MNTATLISQIFHGAALNSAHLTFLDSILEEMYIPKGTTLLSANDPVHTQYYVIDGCLRTYFIDESGKEHTLQFAIKDWWISDYTAFFKEENAIMHIESLQDTTVYGLSRKNMESMFEAIPQLESFFRVKLERAFSSFQKRILANLSKTAKERYLDFIHTYPNIEQSVKNYHIASYLGITTESLSRIRRQLTAE
ncbi:Crp/Fnr family transcriptional regulator [Aquimarina brevivitae]|uniref:CRP-like cAMP-binding protein n=1 Tax=Aquimarina brevivitae TaxID=323412 RepID=A0A4Q7NW60_9FLAO|nr:Crp/Fnr family transcriptional regulator [Aquimarina brevivitae]RZS90632.1 CRP-like cAMP-binding protein [Aquimarina brevivitae]